MEKVIYEEGYTVGIKTVCRMQQVLYNIVLLYFVHPIDIE